MLQFTEFLEEIEHNDGTVVIDGRQAERLAAQFGPQVRTMGVWNQESTGPIEADRLRSEIGAELFGAGICSAK